jgi:ribosomal-protein-alanine N-acetyltransferase
MLSIPHPYEEGMAERFIEGARRAFEVGERVNFAVVLSEGGTLLGGVTLSINSRDDNAGLGYWIGVPYWGRGYATEAVREVGRYGFEELGLHRIHSDHFGSNPASGRVLQKAGLSYEGTRREHYKKWGNTRIGWSMAFSPATGARPKRDSIPRPPKNGLWRNFGEHGTSG